MKDNKLTITIDKPVSELFAFTLDPTNTPKWISFIHQEERNESPTKEGTQYRNTGGDGKWSSYRVSDFEEDKTFTFNKIGSNYHCRYTFTPMDNGTTELEYYEWVDAGELDDPFRQDILEKLKDIIEK